MLHRSRTEGINGTSSCENGCAWRVEIFCLAGSADISCLDRFGARVFKSSQGSYCVAHQMIVVRGALVAVPERKTPIDELLATFREISNYIFMVQKPERVGLVEDALSFYARQNYRQTIPGTVRIAPILLK